MTVIVLGAKGMLGTDICRALTQHKIPFQACDRECNITDPASLAKLPSADWVINCAAYTQVDGCETERDTASLVNGQALRHIGAWALKNQAKVIHFSTDYVFNGTKDGMYIETDATDPINVYGHSKLEGEQALIDSGAEYYVLRIQWLYGEHGPHFIKTIAKLAETKSHINVVDDQVGAPTWTQTIAEAVYRLITHPPECGIYHFSSKGEVNWYHYSKLIIELLDLDLEVSPVSTEAYPRPAKRPLNSRLNCAKFDALQLMDRPYWEDDVKRYLEKL